MPSVGSKVPSASCASSRGGPSHPQELETLRLAQSLVEQARQALGGEEYERAANLAAKAQTLAEDLSTRR